MFHLGAPLQQCPSLPPCLYTVCGLRPHSHHAPSLLSCRAWAASPQQPATAQQPHPSHVPGLPAALPAHPSTRLAVPRIHLVPHPAPHHAPRCWCRLALAVKHPARRLPLPAPALRPSRAQMNCCHNIAWPANGLVWSVCDPAEVLLPREAVVGRALHNNHRHWVHHLAIPAMQVCQHVQLRAAEP